MNRSSSVLSFHTIAAGLLLTAASVAAPVAAAQQAAQPAQPATDASQQASQPSPLGAAQAAYAECAALAESNPQERQARRAAQAAGEHAESLFRAVLRADPGSVPARFGLATTLSRCRIPFAGAIRVMSLSSEAVELLEAVLAQEPEHWDARFTLAMNFYHMPAFLGRGSDAIEHLERLIEQQGDRNDAPHLALPYLRLGELYARSRRPADARAIWERGAALFPGDPALAGRVSSARAAGGTASEERADAGEEDSTAAAAESSSPEPSQVVALSPLRVEVSNQQLEAARSGTALRRMDVVTMPGGRGDMLEALQASPGTTRAADGSELYVRGGDPAETAILFDGGRMPFPGRWESLSGSVAGAVDAMVLRRAFFSSGGFSARYGNALSGVVDVETEGRPVQSSLRAGANMVQAGVSGRAPLGPRTGVWATVAAADVSLLARMNGEHADYARAPRSLQAIAGAAYEPRRGVELRAVGLSLGDEFSRRVQSHGYEGDFTSRGATHHASVSGRVLSGDGRFGVTGSMTGSVRRSAFEFGVLDRSRTDRALGGRLDADRILGGGLRVRGGVEAMRLTATVDGRVPTTAVLAPGAPWSALGTVEAEATHAGGYVEAEHAPVSGLALVAGVRVDRLPGNDAVTVDPRAAAAYTTHGWTARVGGGVFHQGSWRARYRLPDPDVPGGVPTRARHAIVGLERSSAADPALRVEAYRKWYDDYVAAGDGPQAGAGVATGLDAIARWARRDGLNGWISYSLLRGEVELEDGRRVPSAVDVTHSLTIVGRQPIGTTWEVGATGRLGTGRPYTPVVRMEPASAPDAPPQPVFGPIHGDRLPRYARLDGRLTRYIFAPAGTAVLYVEMINLLGRRNLMGYTHEAESAQRVDVPSFFARRSFVAGVEVMFR
jgi:vitamin B12 transporter